MRLRFRRIKRSHGRFLPQEARRVIAAWLFGVFREPIIIISIILTLWNIRVIIADHEHAIREVPSRATFANRP
jgi:hypothetical protein